MSRARRTHSRGNRPDNQRRFGVNPKNFSTFPIFANLGVVTPPIVMGTGELNSRHAVGFSGRLSGRGPDSPSSCRANARGCGPDPRVTPPPHRGQFPAAGTRPHGVRGEVW